jgi:glycerophosphoryl diester phosphodiesterase
MFRTIVAIILLLDAASVPVWSAEPLPWPLVIAHRGASGLLPEHTLEAYALAIEQGAHFIEPDLVRTRDGVLIARHENELSDTTDVADKFPERKTTRVVDGRSGEGWFVEDFTFSEIKTLRARQRLPFRDQSQNGKFTIPSFEEILTLIAQETAIRDHPIGIYPETKHSRYHRDIGLPLEEPLVAALNRAGLTSSENWIFIQSFEVSNLRALNEMTEVKLVQLLGADTDAPFDQLVAGKTYGDMMTPAGLTGIATYADAIGPWKALILPQDVEGNPFPATDLISRAHTAGLVVHAYTFRNEPQYLIKPYNEDPLAEYRRFFQLGVDGVFSDFPATAISALP